ncbi:hypothetical protein M2454_001482 [Aequitasia blattaphilus]|uniref:DUF4250 domain-containing protein n=1 Tax=Aequitasia blattaphilus TaxID=2949332 RepID=A0ABT1E771_9FIRM|nr:DUF4250 domain-containing protein [Aequitasia blattaphilus]MCP1101683.1 DUF4250 domain-containing protein [Aequitasia blattaphilus]MCR8614323.1 DUF4250 domain-containing protein [Aequitasia blattaphilus]
MIMKLPTDPVILLSVINTKLRDFYSTLDDLCEDMSIEKTELENTLNSIDYQYDKKRNQFV